MKFAFVGMMTLLDRQSGAAHSARGFLETLAAAGHQCASYTATSFDRTADIDLAPIFGAETSTQSAKGEVLIHTQAGVEHHVFVTSHTHRSGVERDEWIQMAETGKQWIKDNPADVIITYGINPITSILQREARASGAQMVFYLGNAELTQTDNIEDGDKVLCPSAFLAGHYRNTLRLDADVLRTVIPQNRFLAPAEQLFRQHPEWRKQGFITFMNPQPIKGIGLIARLIDTMAARIPDMNFLIVSGRLNTHELRLNGGLLQDRPNVWCIEPQEDVKSIYRRTSVLLLPSVWQEGASRTIAEAQLSGIPVIASNRGGNSERLNGAGYCLELPARLLADNRIIPKEADIQAWIDTLLLLWHDEAEYATAARRAPDAAASFHPDAVRQQALDYFEALA